MASVNRRAPAKAPIFTAEGARAVRTSTLGALTRTLMSCLLWENEFYESGTSIAQRIAELTLQVTPQEAAGAAIEARTNMHLRHAPLWVARALAQGTPEQRAVVKDLLPAIIQRPDELTEFLALYWKDKRQPLAAGVKKGLAAAFRKFKPETLAKYNREGAVRLRDVLFLSHAKPINAAQKKAWKQLIDGTLPAPDTWEVALSAGANKEQTFRRLITEGKLGGLALLRNLRKMQNEDVSPDVIRYGLATADFSRVLPFRFLAAAKFAVGFESEIEAAMFRTLEQTQILPGKTIIVIDVSGSMYGSPVSTDSDMTRAEAAYVLAMILREVCETPRIYATAGNDYSRQHATALVPSRRGFALRDALAEQARALGGGGIFLTPVMRHIEGLEKTADRIIVITDEQDCAIGAGDAPAKAKPFGVTNYLLNVSSHKNGIGYGPWLHIDGWSEAVVHYIQSRVPSRSRTTDLR